MSSRNLRKKRGVDPVRPEAKASGFDRLENQLFAGPVAADTKTIRLCHQVEEAISYALVCSTTPLLRDLYVAGVEPLKGAASLRVVVAMSSTEGETTDYEQTIEALDRAHGYVRGEVARAINRKRVPSLQFSVLPPIDGSENPGVGS